MHRSRHFKVIGMLVAIICSLTVADSLAQSPYRYPHSNPFGVGAASPYYQPPERYAATRPVSYTFPVRRDYATAYAMQTDPRWGNVPQQTGVQPVTAYRPVTHLNRPNYSGQFANPHGYRGGVYSGGCPSGYQPAAAIPRVAPPYYPGSGLFGSTKHYVDGEPVRNFLRFLTP